MTTDRAAYLRQYYLDHKSEIQKRRQGYKTYDKQYHQDHRDEIHARQRTYHADHYFKFMRAAAKARAKAKGIPFDLTEDYLESICPEYCPILGVKLEPGRGKPQPNSPSLDRIKPELGYVRGNVQIISHRANGMKSDASWDDLLRFADWVQANVPIAVMTLLALPS